MATPRRISAFAEDDDDEEDWNRSAKGYSFEDEGDSWNAAKEFSKQSMTSAMLSSEDYDDSIATKAEEQPQQQQSHSRTSSIATADRRRPSLLQQQSQQQQLTTEELRIRAGSHLRSAEQPPTRERSSADRSTTTVGSGDASFSGLARIAAPSTTVAEGGSVQPPVAENSAAPPQIGKIIGEAVQALKTHVRSPSSGSSSSLASGGRGRAEPEKVLVVQSSTATLPAVTAAVPVHIEDAMTQPSWAEITKLKAQISTLERQLKAVHGGDTAPAETVRRIVCGKPHVLEPYKSKRAKIALLNEAVATGDGNAIMTIVLFLKSTLSASKFGHIILENTVALNHYQNYLRATGAYDELENSLTMAGQIDEAAMLRYKRAVTLKNPEAKMRDLKLCVTTHFSLDTQSADRAKIEAHISLLEMQLAVERADSEAEVSGRNLLLKQLKRTSTIIDSSLVNTLHYCCLYHYDEQESHQASPRRLRKMYEIPEKQYLWAALAALATFRRWAQIDDLLSTKNLFGKAQLKCAIGFDKLVGLLHRVVTDLVDQSNSPAAKMAGTTADELANKVREFKSVMDKYVRCIEGAEERVECAKKYGCHRAVIDTFVQLRDKAALEAYRDKINVDLPEWRYASETLGMTSIKWKP